MVQFLLPASRSLEVVAPVACFRVIGRRASCVYVTDGMRPSGCGSADQRLSEPVYWKTRAVPGDQIQERAGGIWLVAFSGRCHSVRLSPPTPIDVETAFTHAERAIKADRVLIDALLADGVLVGGAYRRPQGPPSFGLRRLLPEDHPLVLEELPIGLEAEIGQPPRKVFRQWGQVRGPASWP